MDDTVLATDRLVLRPAAADDLAWILATINTPSMMRFLGGVVRPEADVAKSLADDIAAFDTPGGHQRWTAWLGGARVGRVGLFHIRSDAAPAQLRDQREIGWMFAEAHQGRGLATEAARAVLGLAFGRRSVPVVFSQTSDSNAASTRMMRRLGFARRAELDYVDPDYPAADNPTTVWSLAANDWKQQ